MGIALFPDCPSELVKVMEMVFMQRSARLNTHREDK